MNSLQPLLQHQLRSLFDAEVQFNVILPRMIARSTDALLRDGLEEISDDTWKNIRQIQDVCNLLQTTPTGVVCKTMQELIREAADTTRAAQDAASVDAGLLVNAQSIVHFEIASFNLASLFARSLGREDASLVLTYLTNRADFHDQLLTQIALASGN